ncbi:RNA-binding domain-containing protein [Ascoidea rubescens DSM 1968]|uniref:RNA-binding domain-containing protein n=1 Tax=Ascoidea rubescens DSM 1968 TaxID=1344418 RepID=A0A1D2VQY7_9ASCO|nr:RNA-binding domain-containing protein [Ascoidea rubescens DSM 1968]ODV63977.1 RNA-binding domain-containing protein [Ascoidea rubescens DSM 1968]
MLLTYGILVGEVARADIVTSHGVSRGMGILTSSNNNNYNLICIRTVEFVNEEDVQKAIDRFNHTTFLGREIFVREDNPPPEQRDSGRDRYSDRYRERDRYDRNRDRDRGRFGGRDRYDRGGRDDRRYDRHDRYDREGGSYNTSKGYEIFVANLPFSVNWQRLKDLFREIGDIIRADVAEDYRGRSKGYGTVSFATKEESDRAIEKFNGREVEGRQLDVRASKFNPPDESNDEDGERDFGRRSSSRSQSSKPKDEDDFPEGIRGLGEKSNTIFASNLPWSTSDDDLYDLFETVGVVDKAKIQLDSTGRGNGSAVVRFEQEDDATTAIERLDGFEYGKRDLRISYALFPPSKNDVDTEI